MGTYILNYMQVTMTVLISSHLRRYLLLCNSNYFVGEVLQLGSAISITDYILRTQCLFDHRKCILDGVEIRRIRRKKLDPHTLILTQFFELL